MAQERKRRRFTAEYNRATRPSAAEWCDHLRNLVLPPSAGIAQRPKSPPKFVPGVAAVPSTRPRPKLGSVRTKKPSGRRGMLMAAARVAATIFVAVVYQQQSSQ